MSVSKIKMIISHLKTVSFQRALFTTFLITPGKPFQQEEEGAIRSAAHDAIRYWNVYMAFSGYKDRERKATREEDPDQGGRINAKTRRGEDRRKWAEHNKDQGTESKPREPEDELRDQKGIGKTHEQGNEKTHAGERERERPGERGRDREKLKQKKRTEKEAKGEKATEKNNEMKSRNRSAPLFSSFGLQQQQVSLSVTQI